MMSYTFMNNSDPAVTLALFMGVVGALVAGYVVQSTSLGSPIQVLTLAGVIYLIVKDILGSFGGGRRA